MGPLSRPLSLEGFRFPRKYDLSCVPLPFFIFLYVRFPLRYERPVGLPLIVITL